MKAKSFVSFWGGPFDGHCQAVTLSPEELAPLTLLPVSRNTFRLLSGESALEHALPVTSIAVYQLASCGSNCCYRFVRALDPAETPTKS